jgi:hypothetical protein
LQMCARHAWLVTVTVVRVAYVDPHLSLLTLAGRASSQYQALMLLSRSVTLWSHCGGRVAAAVTRRMAAATALESHAHSDWLAAAAAAVEKTAAAWRPGVYQWHFATRKSRKCACCVVTSGLVIDGLRRLSHETYCVRRLFV